MCLKHFFEALHFLSNLSSFKSIIRVEIDSYLADYYPEIDAISLVGTETYPSFQESLKLSVSGLSLKVVGLGLHHFLPDFDALESIQSLCLAYKSQKGLNGCHLDKLPVKLLLAFLSPSIT